MKHSIQGQKKFNNDFISKPIPKWITFYGFGFLFTLVGILVYASTQFTARRIVTVDVVISPDSSLYIQSSFSQYDILRKLQVGKIFLDNKSIPVGVDFTKSVLEGNNIRTPIIVLGTAFVAGEFGHERRVKGSILIEESSLLSKLFER